MKTNTFMRLVLVALFLVAPLRVFAEQVLVPGVGSEWLYRMYYSATDNTSGQHHVRVKAMRYGRPVFSADFMGREVAIFEEGDFITILEEACESDYEAQPPTMPPNTCGWVPCTVSVGQTIERVLNTVTTFSGCQSKLGTATFTGLKEIEVMTVGVLEKTVKTRASVKIPKGGSQVWFPHIAPGKGEVYAESPGMEARYDRIAITSVPHTFVIAKAPKKLEEPIVPARARYEVRPNTPVWVAFGDSLTQGVGAKPEESYPKVLEGLLASRGLQVVNAGIAGQKTADLLERVEDILALAPEVVLLGTGANDVLGATPPAELEEAIVTLVGRITQSGARVVLLGIEVDNTSPYAGIYARVAARTKAIFVKNMLEGVYKVPEMTSQDRIHPNAKGYARMAKIIHGALEGNTYAEAPSSDCDWLCTLRKVRPALGAVLK